MTAADPVERRLLGAASDLATATGATLETTPLATGVTAPPRERGAREPVEHLPPSVDGARVVLQRFTDHLTAAGLHVDTSTAVDLVAAFLSSQFLLFAGPSGTGKSTVARALGQFFCTPGSFGIVEGRRQLIGPEDLVGYYSPLSDTYVRVPDLRVVRRLADPAAQAAPALLVEEVNLSAVEGYLAPFVHATSGVSTDAVVWELHDAPIDEPPPRLVLAPFPRLLGTINVDASSTAPARKVAARACVLLLEPADDPAVAAALQHLKAPPASSPAGQGAGAAFVGDPTEIFAYGVASDAELVREADALIDVVRGGPTMPNPLSRRQVLQVLTYASWFVLLAEAHVSEGGRVLGDPHRLAVENALLHYVLPTLPPVDFARALQRLQDGATSLTPSSSSPQELGAVLRDRVQRLAGAADVSGMGTLDFWDRLS